MKTPQQIETARNVVAKNIVRDGMSEDQKLLLGGMSVALCWVADAGGRTLQALIDGMEVEPGKTNAEAKQNLKDAGIELEYFR